MVAADVALASLSDADTDKVMNGDISVPSTPQRDALFEKLERAERSAESTVQILVTMGTAVAAGTAVGSGLDPGPVEQRARKSGEASRQTMEENMREPLRRYLAYGYRDLSDADLKHVLSFLQSTAGKQYMSAYLASLGAGFDAMGRRCGEQLGESLRELAMAQLATERAEQAQDRLPPNLVLERLAARAKCSRQDPLQRGQEIAQQMQISRSDPPTDGRNRARAASHGARAPSGCCCRPARCHRASHARWRWARPRPAAYMLRSPACRRPAPAKTGPAASSRLAAAAETCPPMLEPTRASGPLSSRPTATSFSTRCAGSSMPR